MRNVKWSFVLLLIVMAVVSGVSLGCSGDEWLDYEEDSKDEILDKKIKCKEKLSYLDVESTDCKTWTDDDYAAIADAAIRMGVSFSKEQRKYVFRVSTPSEINISDRLFNLVRSQFEYTNSIICPQIKTLAGRKKTFSPESTQRVPNCVPVAISRMGKKAPTYSDAVAICDSLDGGWRENNGVRSFLVGPIIRYFTPVSSVDSFDSYSSDTDFDKCVMLLKRDGVRDHAVNATKLEVRKVMDGTTKKTVKIIFYYDYTGNSSYQRSVLPEEVSAIYPF